ncbi:MAG: RNA-binding domain-containing protein [Candidatus Nezhaarchaeales archaeon]
MLVRVKAEVHETEDPDKVRKAIENIVTPQRLYVKEEGDGKFMVGEADSPEALLKLHEALRRQQILDAARAMIKRYSSSGVVRFYLHKQAAYVGRVTFCLPKGESPLGPIEVIVETNKDEALINWLAPPTSGGRPKYEEPMPRD